MKLKYLLSSLILLIFMSLPVHAHWADMSALELTIDNQTAKAILTIPTKFLEKIDLNKDGKISDDEIKKSNQEILDTLKDQVFIKGDGEMGKLTVSPAQDSNVTIAGSSSQSSLNLNWTWENPVKNFKLHYSLFPKDAINAQCLVSANVDGQNLTLTFNQSNTEMYLKQLSTFENIKQFIFLGIEHIATGYDHILFLVALLLAGGGFRYLLKIVSAFTVAHSITLSLSVLNIVSIPSRLVESCIAASIIYVAVENIWKKREEAHWSLVFLFGLVHGLGFASLLHEMDIPRNNIISTLVSFNVGIEIGQLIIVSIAWTLLKQIRKSKEGVYTKIRTGGSFAIVAIASIWFVQRAFLGM